MKRDKYLDLARELKKNYGTWRCWWYQLWWCTWNNPQRIGKGAGRLGNKRTSRDHPDYNIIINIGQNPEKCPGELRLPDTQTLVKNYQLMLVWKTLKGVNNNNNNLLVQLYNIKYSYLIQVIFTQLYGF